MQVIVKWVAPGNGNAACRLRARNRRRSRAYSLIELLIIIAWVLFAAALALFWLQKSRQRGCRISCVNNVKQIGLSFRTWTVDHDGQYPMQMSVTNGGTRELIASGFVFPHYRVMSNELYTPRILLCPEDQGRKYLANSFDAMRDTQISYFVNVDAVETARASWLCGDRNLTNKPEAGSRFVSITPTTTMGWGKEMHGKRGYVCLADGSVQGYSNGVVAAVAQRVGGLTNRLAVP